MHAGMVNTSMPLNHPSPNRTPFHCTCMTVSVTSGMAAATSSLMPAWMGKPGAPRVCNTADFEPGCAGLLVLPTVQALGRACSTGNGQAAPAARSLHPGACLRGCASSAPLAGSQTRSRCPRPAMGGSRLPGPARAWLGAPAPALTQAGAGQGRRRVGTLPATRCQSGQHAGLAAGQPLGPAGRRARGRAVGSSHHDTVAWFEGAARVSLGHRPCHITARHLASTQQYCEGGKMASGDHRCRPVRALSWRQLHRHKQGAAAQSPLGGLQTALGSPPAGSADVMEKQLLPASQAVDAVAARASSTAYPASAWPSHPLPRVRQVV